MNIIDYSLLIGIHNRTSPERPVSARKSNPRWTESDMGGMFSSDGSKIYFMGIIDIMTVYNTKKEIEHNAKALWYGKEGIS